MVKKTVFEVFGIENKETKVSNLFSYYIRTSKAFRDLLCDLAEINRIQNDSQIKVDREFYFKLEGYDNKNNFIDILIRIGNDIDNPERVICIENKIYSDEGYKQTERYQKGMEQEFRNAQRDYIFVTKNNSFVNLSSINFKHIKYMDIIKNVKKNDELISMDYMKDFCEFYYDREHEEYCDMEEKNKISNSDSFIDYFVWKANSGTQDNDFQYSDLCVCSGISAKNSRHRYFQVSKQSWLIKDTGISDEMSIHLEGDNERLVLHFETYPYVPFKKLPKDIKTKYEEKRDLLREKLLSEIVIDNDVKVSGPDKRGTLTLLQFDISVSDDLKRTLEILIKIIKAVDDKVSKAFPKRK